MTTKPKEYMSYEEYLEKVKTGIVTEDGRCPVTPLLVMLQGRWKSQLMYSFGFVVISSLLYSNFI